MMIAQLLPQQAHVCTLESARRDEHAMVVRCVLCERAVVQFLLPRCDVPGFRDSLFSLRETLTPSIAEPRARCYRLLYAEQ